MRSSLSLSMSSMSCKVQNASMQEQQLKKLLKGQRNWASFFAKRCFALKRMSSRQFWLWGSFGCWFLSCLRNHDDDGLNYVVSEGPKLANNHEEDRSQVGKWEIIEQSNDRYSRHHQWHMMIKLGSWSLLYGTFINLFQGKMTNNKKSWS